MRWAQLVLLDAPAFVIRTWLRLYMFVLAAGSIICWIVLIYWLAGVVWREYVQPQL